jgi:hypothetical protein
MLPSLFRRSMVRARALLLACVTLAVSGAALAAEVGGYPNATALGGTERILADQSGTTVNLTPVQMAVYSAMNIPTAIRWVELNRGLSISPATVGCAVPSCSSDRSDSSDLSIRAGSCRH